MVQTQPGSIWMESQILVRLGQRELKFKASGFIFIFIVFRCLKLNPGLCVSFFSGVGDKDTFEDVK